jgi:hypothetical protein
MNAVTTQTTGSAVAVNDVSNPYAAYAAEASSRTIVGTLLKFAKGEWTKGQNDVVVPVGTKFVADMRNVQVGWTRWADKKPAEHMMGCIADGYRSPARSTLGYTDKSEWELDKESKPQDPWQATSIIFLMDTEGEMYTYSPSSAGGRNAVIALCGAYGKLMRQHPGELPVIEIGVDSYRHETYGKTFVPMLKIIGWHSEKDFDEAQEAEAQEAAARAENDAAEKGEAVQTKEQVAEPVASDSGFGFKKGAKKDAPADAPAPAGEPPKKAARF